MKSSSVPGGPAAKPFLTWDHSTGEVAAAAALLILSSLGRMAMSAPSRHSLMSEADTCMMSAITEGGEEWDSVTAAGAVRTNSSSSNSSSSGIEHIARARRLGKRT